MTKSNLVSLTSKVYNLKVITFFRRRPYLPILILILTLGLFFRTYEVLERFEFAHDGDLYSWIVKDILINHHFRLIGQLTSAPGIFIGGLFYYLLIPFFILSNMDPIGVIFFAIIIGLLTIVSYYLVFSKLFNVEVGLFGAFFYAIFISTVNFDRWVVPTITTNLWVIWYFYAIVKIARGKFSVLPLLGILIGLIWHIHIALIPALIAIPTALYISRNFPTIKQISLFLIALFLASSPLIIFELRHNFIQTSNLINNLVIPQAGPQGFYKFQLVLEMIIKNINTLFFAPLSLTLTNSILFVLGILISALLLLKKGLLSSKELVPLYAWLFGVILFFSVSKSPISEYYFKNIEVIFLSIVSILFYLLSKSSKLGRVLVFSILVLVFIKNSHFLVKQNYYHKGYVEKKELVKYISEDAKVKGYPCVGISYITTPGENVGFRYFFYLSNLHLVHPSLDIPVYNIVIPDELSKEVTRKFGHIGIIPPTNVVPKEIIQKQCQGPNTNLTDPLFGYVE